MLHEQTSFYISDISFSISVYLLTFTFIDETFDTYTIHSELPGDTYRIHSETTSNSTYV